MAVGFVIREPLIKTTISESLVTINEEEVTIKDTHVRQTNVRSRYWKN